MELSVSTSVLAFTRFQPPDRDARRPTAAFPQSPPTCTPFIYIVILQPRRASGCSSFIQESRSEALGLVLPGPRRLARAPSHEPAWLAQLAQPAPPLNRPCCMHLCISACPSRRVLGQTKHQSLAVPSKGDSDWNTRSDLELPGSSSKPS